MDVDCSANIELVRSVSVFCRDDLKVNEDHQIGQWVCLSRTGWERGGEKLLFESFIAARNCVPSLSVLQFGLPDQRPEPMPYRPNFAFAQHLLLQLDS